MLTRNGDCFRGIVKLQGVTKNEDSWNLIILNICLYSRNCHQTMVTTMGFPGQQTSRTGHPGPDIQDIRHLGHQTSRTSDIQDIRYPGHQTSRTSDIQDIRHPGQIFQSHFWAKNYLSWMSDVLDIWCPGCLMSWMSDVLDIWCPGCLMSWISDVLDIWCPRCLMSWMSAVLDVP